MITGELKSKVDKIWDTMWSGGIANPISVIEQLTYLLFIKRLDELHTLKEHKANRLKKPIEDPIFTDDQDSLRWSRFKETAPEQMFNTVRDEVFPFIKTLGKSDTGEAEANSTYTHHMKDALFMMPTPKRSEAAYWGGEIPWVKISDMLQGLVQTTDEMITERGLAESAAKLLPSGTILISIFATIGRTATLGIEAATNQAIVGVIPKKKGQFHLPFLRYCLEDRALHLQSISRGVAQANINGSVLKQTLIPLPPLSEQKRIAGILDAADALRAKRRDALAQLDTLLQATFLDMFGDPVTNPKGWAQVDLASLIADDDKINYGVVQPGDDYPEGKPLVRVGDFVGGVFDPSAIKLISPKIESKYSRSRLNGRELLISCVGSIGVVCKVPESAKGFNIARAVARVPLRADMDRDFVLHCLRSEAVQRYFEKETRTVSQPTLNIGLIKSAPVLQPPTEKQQRFAAAVESIEQQVSRGRSHLAELDTLFASLQQRAFAGAL